MPISSKASGPYKCEMAEERFNVSRLKVGFVAVNFLVRFRSGFSWVKALSPTYSNSDLVLIGFRHHIIPLSDFEGERRLPLPHREYTFATPRIPKPGSSFSSINLMGTDCMSASGARVYTLRRSSLLSNKKSP
jgi:hypothetical protein